jgi:hypothetical protein
MLVLTAGAGWSANSSTIDALGTERGIRGGEITDTSPTTSFDKSGGFGGGQIGYNLQSRDEFPLYPQPDTEKALSIGSGLCAAALAMLTIVR